MEIEAGKDNAPNLSAAGDILPVSEASLREEARQTVISLEAFFRPRAIAVIGASRRRATIG